MAHRDVRAEHQPATGRQLRSLPSITNPFWVPFFPHRGSPPRGAMVPIAFECVRAQFGARRVAARVVAASPQPGTQGHQWVVRKVLRTLCPPFPPQKQTPRPEGQHVACLGGELASNNKKHRGETCRQVCSETQNAVGSKTLAS